MKNIKIYVILLIAPLFVQSCGDDWLESEPSTSLTKLELKSLADVNSTLNGMYIMFRSDTYYGARMTYYGDLTGEDVQSKKSGSKGSGFYKFSYDKSTALATTWNLCYDIIVNANFILSQIEAIDVYTTDEEKRVKDELKKKDFQGQTLALRALAYFDLMRLYSYPYAKKDEPMYGVPIVDKVVDMLYKPKRNTVDECYKFIVNDLLTAVGDLDKGEKGLLTEEKIKSSRINRWAAMALLSRVYLYMDNNEKALQYAEAAIIGAEANGYGLWSNASYTSSWAEEFSSESLYEIPITPTENVGNEAIGYLCFPEGYDAIILSNDFLSLITKDKNDVRYKSIIEDIHRKATDKEKVGRRYLWKYVPNPSDNGRHAFANVIVIRLSEVYLIAAEAAVKIQDNSKATKYLEAIVNRGNPANSVSGDVTVDQILIERRKELVGEGHRMFDALRNNKRITRTKSTTLGKPGPGHLSAMMEEAWDFDWTYHRVVQPIPLREMEANENMRDQQNPGY